MGDPTILDRLDANAKSRGDRPALLEPRSSTYDAWDMITWAEYARHVRMLARAFIALGHEKGDGVAIIGPNRPAWVIADLAAIAAGGLPAGIYATATEEQAEYILGHALASIAVVVDEKQTKKILALRPKLPKLRAIILFPGVAKPNEPGATDFVVTWDEAMSKGQATPDARIDEIRGAMKANDPATLIYTSGTTGPPKAVALSHRNLTWTAEQTPSFVPVQAGDRGISYLPLAHVAEQMMTIHVPVTFGVVIHFVPVMEQLGDALRSVRPHTVFGVPRVWEKIQAKVEAGVDQAPPSRKRLFRFAQEIGLKVMTARYEGHAVPLPLQLGFKLMDRLVYSKVKQRLGLDATRMVLTGAAPLPGSTRRWLLSLGIEISEVYGQSEDCGPTTFNLFGKGRLGTVGRPLEGVEVKIAGDGEILVRGPNVFLGYYKDEAATKDALKEGWLHSGDVGELDRDGFLKITDRKKDLIITAGGKNISPQNIEKLLTEIPLVSQAVVIGDQRRYLSALVTLVPERLAQFSKDHGISPADPQNPTVRAEIQKAIDRTVNAKLAKYETIKRFEILPAELSEVSGELTPTMKIKRKVVSTKYAAAIERLYEGADSEAAA